MTRGTSTRFVHGSRYSGPTLDCGGEYMQPALDLESDSEGGCLSEVWKLNNNLLWSHVLHVRLRGLPCLAYRLCSCLTSIAERTNERRETLNVQRRDIGNDPT